LCSWFDSINPDRPVPRKCMARCGRKEDLPGGRRCLLRLPPFGRHQMISVSCNRLPGNVSKPVILQMTYTIKNSDWHWLIEPDAKSKKYLLKYKKPTQWTSLREYDTPEEAAEAVSTGNTGLPEWDAFKRLLPFPNFTSWLIDPNDTFGLSEILG